jgi:hypothetical protein
MPPKAHGKPRARKTAASGGAGGATDGAAAAATAVVAAAGAGSHGCLCHNHASYACSSCERSALHAALQPMSAAQLKGFTDSLESLLCIPVGEVRHAACTARRRRRHLVAPALACPPLHRTTAAAGVSSPRRPERTSPCIF